MKQTNRKWRFSEVVKDIKSAKEFIKINAIKNYEIVIIWDEGDEIWDEGDD